MRQYQKLLTISIAAYNMEKYLAKTLSSLVLENTYMDDMEVLIINDGSTDNTAAVAEEYVQKYPSVFRIINKENGGYGTAVNRGIQEASGKYFKLLDGDDWFDTSALRDFLRILRTEETDLIITDYVERYASGKRIQKKVNCKYGKQHSMKHQFFALPMHAVCSKTYILKDNDIRLEQGILYTDIEYVLYLLFYTKSTSHYPIFLYQYRLGRKGQSVDRKNRCRHIDDEYKVYENLKSYYNNHTLDNEYEMTILYMIALKYNMIVYMLLAFNPSRKIKKKLIATEKELKTECPIVYLISAGMSAKVLLLRRSSYSLYYLLSVYTHMINMIKDLILR